MATVSQAPPTIAPRLEARGVKQSEPEFQSTGIWIGLAAITMMFAALTSAMVVRQGSASDWRHFSFPVILYLNTAVIAASSVTMQISKRRFAVLVSGVNCDHRPSQTALYGTLILGCTFVIGQYTAWQQLRSDGLYLAFTPSSSFFYVFTVLHALHVIGGLFGLVYVVSKLRRGGLSVSALSAASQYWHFMAVLWIYLLVVLRIRI
jgi:cytochrome c oxidase subunit 3